MLSRHFVAVGVRVARWVARVLAAAWLVTSLAWPAAALACGTPPSPVVDLNLVRYYTDKAGTRIDNEKRRHNELVRRPLKQFLTYVTAKADDAVRYQDDRAARCGLAWLRSWATGRAYLGNMESKQSEYQRKWDLAGASLAYLKLRRWASAADRSVIEPWLSRWSVAALAYFDNPGHRRNNHWYWLGLGLAATGLATDNDAFWRQARGIFDDAMGDITDAGTLPMESARKVRALHYHTFSATPLVAMAELARARGEDWYAGNGAKLHSLVAVVARGHVDEDAAKALSTDRVKQSPTKPGFGWLPIYARRFPGRLAVSPANVKRSHVWLGGSVGPLLSTLDGMRVQK